MNITHPGPAHRPTRNRIVSEHSLAGVLNRPAGADQSLSLISHLTAEMRECWHAGRPITAEAFFALHPELDDQPDAATRLILEEFCLRQERGEPVDLDEFL